MKIMSVYDGTIQSKTILRYGLRKIQEKGGELIVLQVFQSGLFLDYDAGPRAEEIARAEAERHRRDAQAIIEATAPQQMSVRVVSEEGDTVEETLRVAGREKVDMILATPRYKAIAKKAPCPVYIIPGTILVPVDTVDAARNDLETIIAEVKATGSRILLLGVVPIHLFSAAEREELEQIRKKTAGTVKKMATALHAKGIELSEVIRSGYPDEEILKAADEFSVSLIMLPAGGKTPSELTKAAAILLDEPDRVKRPVYLLAQSV
jgi:nucleotide-binding universal stress UspA family protein